MARQTWSHMVDCRTADYVVPEDVEITELRTNAAGEVGLRGGNGEQVTLHAVDDDIFSPPTIPTTIRRVVRMETTAALRNGAITLYGLRS